MSDRYEFSETSQPQEGWSIGEAERAKAEAEMAAMLSPEQGEIVYAAARDVLLDAGVPYPRAVYLAEAVRKRALGL